MSLSSVVLIGRQPLLLPHAEEYRIECVSGRVWVTMEHDTRDIVLAPGEHFVVDRPGTTLVSAARSAGIRLLGPDEYARAMPDPGEGVSGWALPHAAG